MNLAILISRAVPTDESFGMCSSRIIVSNSWTWIFDRTAKENSFARNRYSRQITCLFKVKIIIFHSDVCIQQQSTPLHKGGEHRLAPAQYCYHSS